VTRAIAATQQLVSFCDAINLWRIFFMKPMVGKKPKEIPALSGFSFLNPAPDPAHAFYLVPFLR
jgi:hypothetical protein